MAIPTGSFYGSATRSPQPTARSWSTGGPTFASRARQTTPEEPIGGPAPKRVRHTAAHQSQPSTPDYFYLNTQRFTLQPPEGAASGQLRTRPEPPDRPVRRRRRSPDDVPDAATEPRRLPPLLPLHDRLRAPTGPTRSRARVGRATGGHVRHDGPTRHGLESESSRLLKSPASVSVLQQPRLPGTVGGDPQPAQGASATISDTRRKIQAGGAGWVGGLPLILGTFLPLITLPVARDETRSTHPTTSTSTVYLQAQASPQRWTRARAPADQRPADRLPQPWSEGRPRLRRPSPVDPVRPTHELGSADVAPGRQFRVQPAVAGSLDQMWVR